jgi:hypothetical protein
MRFYWTEEDVRELLQKLEPHSTDEYVAEHSSFLRMYLRKMPEMKAGIRREQEWKLVEGEARHLENWLEGRSTPETSP